MRTNVFTSMVRAQDIREALTVKEALELWMRGEKSSYKELAEEMGFTQKHISCVVRGKTEMTIDFAIRLEEATNIEALFWLKLYIENFKL